MAKPKHGFKRAKGWQLRIFEICGKFSDGFGWFWLAFSFLVIIYAIVISFFWGPAGVCCIVPMAICMIWGFSRAEVAYLKRLWLAKRAATKIFPPYLKEILEAEVKIYHRLPESLQPGLERKMMQFMESIPFKFKGSFKTGVKDRARVCVAAEACLLVLNRDFSGYRRLKKVEVCSRIEGASGRANRESVELEWKAVQRGLVDCTDGQSVTIHEFAHVLDYADDGRAQSNPFIRGSSEYHRWEEMLDREFNRLWEVYESGEGSVIDSYALKVAREYVSDKPGNPQIRPEFFACATEAFFEQPRELSDEFPKLFDLMREFYRLDPAEWAPSKQPRPHQGTD
ncbi:MAG: zinc-dependent peptidase [Verrucomicrobiota bacterium]|jgi:hypothetical protein|nr:zinc-dependent peptidase [Verrucomicrobiota bacterium]